MTLPNLHVIIVSEINNNTTERTDIMEKIRIKIDEEFENEFKKLGQLLSLLKVDYEIESVDRESMSGAKYEEKYFKLEYDQMKVFKKLNRSPGREKKNISRVLTVREVRKMIDEKTAEVVAGRLGISRRTLFRRLAQAEKNGDKYLF